MAYRNAEEQKAKQRAYYLRNRDAIKAKSKAWREANPERFKAAMRDWHHKNKDYAKERKAVYYRDNAERLKAASRARHHATYVHHPLPEPLPPKEYQAKWRAKHRDRIVAKQRERYQEKKGEILAYNKIWREQNYAAWSAWSKRNRQKNQHKLNAGHAARRAKKRSLPVADREQVFAFYRWVRTAPLVLCHHCGQPVPKNKRHVDHLRPFALGGSHTIDNLVASCERCNCRKGPRSVEDFRALPASATS